LILLLLLILLFLKEAKGFRAMRESLFFTPRVLRSALRAGFAVRAAPAAQWTAKKSNQKKAALTSRPAVELLGPQASGISVRHILCLRKRRTSMCAAPAGFLPIRLPRLTGLVKRRVSNSKIDSYSCLIRSGAIKITGGVTYSAASSAIFTFIPSFSSAGGSSTTDSPADRPCSTWRSSPIWRPRRSSRCSTVSSSVTTKA